MFQVTIQKCIVNIHYFSLQVFNKHSCHHNSESDIIDHLGVVICEIHTRDSAETFYHKSGMVHTSTLQLKYPYTQPIFSLVYCLFYSHVSKHPCPTSSRTSGKSPYAIFLWLSDQEPHQASSKLCGSSGSDIMLVTKPISCNHSFKVFSSFTSGNKLTSGSDPSDCLVLAATGSV